MVNTTMYNFLDARYQVHKIFCGHEQAKYQSLFCDELLGFADTQAEAENRCYQHRLLFYKELEEGFK
jgi:hypothetical protein